MGLQTVGDLMIGYAALKVHFRFWQEHKVDEVVFREMKREQRIGILGLLLIIIGFIGFLITDLWM